MPTRCNRGFYWRSYCLLNMFRAPLCPSSGAQEYYTVVAACGISCCGFQVAAGCCSILQTGRITLSSTPNQQLENHSTKYHRQQPLYNTLELLMMGIVMPETCWASNKICNKNLCCSYLAFYFHILTTMHGQNHSKVKKCPQQQHFRCVSSAFFLYISENTDYFKQQIFEVWVLRSSGDILQRVVAIHNRRFGTTCRSHFERSRSRRRQPETPGTHRVNSAYRVLPAVLTLVDDADRLSRNVGKELPLYAA